MKGVTGGEKKKKNPEKGKRKGSVDHAAMALFSFSTVHVPASGGTEGRKSACKGKKGGGGGRAKSG